MSALGLHGRTQHERTVHPNHNDMIKAVAQKLSIPVIAKFVYLLLFLRLVPSSRGTAMVISIVFCHPQSFFPVPPFSCLSSPHPSTMPSVFHSSFLPDGFISIICLQECSSGLLLTCPNHFNRISVTLLVLFVTHTASRMY